MMIVREYDDDNARVREYDGDSARIREYDGDNAIESRTIIIVPSHYHHRTLALSLSYSRTLALSSSYSRVSLHKSS